MPRRANVPTSVEQLRAARAQDAYNAGYRRGVEGKAPSGRYVDHPRFKEGYEAGQEDSSPGQYHVYVEIEDVGTHRYSVGAVSADDAIQYVFKQAAKDYPGGKLHVARCVRHGAAVVSV